MVDRETPTRAAAQRRQDQVPPTNGMPTLTRSKPMTEGELAWVIQTKLQNSIGFQGGKLAQLRMQAERYYRGDKFGNEVKGRSQVVSRDVAEAIDSMMPSLIKIFTAGEQVVRFDPSAKEAKDGSSAAATLQLIKRAEESAKQATEYVNWIFNTQNPGFLTLYTWFKSALLMKNGIIKIWWDDKPTIYKETYKGLTDDEFAMIMSDESVELLEEDTRPDPSWSPADGIAQLMSMGPGQDATEALQPPQLHDCIFRFTNKDGRVRVAAVPEDEFLIDRRAVSLEETPFCAHKFKTTRTELKEMFPEKEDLIDILVSDEEAEYSMERIERFKDEDELPWRQDNPADPSMREMWVTEAYIKVDYDGDGIAEMRKVTVAGDTGYTVIDNEEFDGQPFAALTPIIMPHKFFGMSITDQTLDVQLIKSTLIRGILDNLYNSIAPQVGVVKGGANLDDLLNRRPGGVIRMENPNALVPLPNPGVGGEPFQMVEYFDTVREQRTGVTRYNQGLDADTLNKTAKGINLIQNAGQERLELIARVFGETGVKAAFRKILELVCKHQQRKKIIKLRGKWVAMDPREWTDQMDVSVNVGLGTGSRDQQMQLMMMLLNLDKEIVQLQQGANGPLVTMENIYNKLEKLVQFGGLGNVTPYYNDPASLQQQGAGQPPQQHQDPKLQAAQIQAQAKQMELAQKTKSDEQEQQLRMQLGMADIALKRELGYADLKLRAQQLGMDAHAAAADQDLRRAQFMTDAAMKVADHHLKRQGQQADQMRDLHDAALEHARFDFQKATLPTPGTLPQGAALPAGAGA